MKKQLFILNSILFLCGCSGQKTNPPIEQSTVNENSSTGLVETQSVCKVSPYKGEFLPQEACCGKRGYYFTGAYIYWKTIFEYDPQVIQTKATTPMGFQDALTIKNISFSYSPGFKLGLGYSFHEVEWDLYANWTRLTTSPNHTKTKADSHGVLDLSGLNDTTIAQSARTQGQIKTNFFDLELGRKFLLEDWLRVRPFAGLKGISIDNHIKTKFSDVSDQKGIVYEQVQAFQHDQPFGIGPRLGVNTNWYPLNRYFSFQFNLAGGVLWEKRKTIAGLTSIEDGIPHGGFGKYNAQAIEPFVELFLGVNGGGCLWNAVTLDLSLGWEFQYYGNQISTTPETATSFGFNGFGVQGATAALRLAY